MFFKYNLNKKHGFTLVELLVVISIISLLSSVVFASLSGGKEKARLAAGLQTSSNLTRVYSSEALGMWDFDEASGNALDSSQYGRTAVANNSPARVTGIHGKAAQFGSSASYFETTASIPSSGTDWTLAAWVYPTSVPTGTQIFLSFSSLPYLGFFTGGVFNLAWNSVSGTPPQQYLTDPSVRKPNFWYFVVATHSGNKTALYIDGKEVDRDNTLPSSTTGGLVDIGRHPSGYYFSGYVDEARVYSQSLLAKDINDLYLAGLEKHKNLALKNNE